MSEDHTRHSSRYLLGVMIVGWCMVFLCAFIMGHLDGIAIAYSRCQSVWLSLIVTAAAVVLGLLIAAKNMARRIRPFVLLAITLTLLVALVALAIDLQDPSMWVTCLLLPAAIAAIGWASGAYARYGREDAVNEFQSQVSLEQARQKLTEIERTALLEAAEDLQEMPDVDRDEYECELAKAILNLCGASKGDPVSLPKVSKVSGCRLPIARIILEEFEAEGWVQVTHEKERTSWEDQIVLVKDKGVGLRRYIVSKKDRNSDDAQRAPLNQVFNASVFAQNLGYVTGKSEQKMSAGEQGTQKIGLDVKDIIYKIINKLIENITTHYIQA